MERVLSTFEGREDLERSPYVAQLPLGLTTAGLGGFWLVKNLTNNLALLAENPGRAVVPALIILAGVAAMFVRRER